MGSRKSEQDEARGSPQHNNCANRRSATADGAKTRTRSIQGSRRGGMRRKRGRKNAAIVGTVVVPHSHTRPRTPRASKDTQAAVLATESCSRELHPTCNPISFTPSCLTRKREGPRTCLVVETNLSRPHRRRRSHGGRHSPCRHSRRTSIIVLPHSECYVHIFRPSSSPTASRI